MELANKIIQPGDEVGSREGEIPWFGNNERPVLCEVAGRPSVLTARGRPGRFSGWTGIGITFIQTGRRS